ncbi:MAG TPA: hypothetical protein VK066_30770 [Chloroflexota bacterium]|nr:hypothetical protein [Chloroflexota bacterium]
MGGLRAWCRAMGFVLFSLGMYVFGFVGLLVVVVIAGLNPALGVISLIAFLGALVAVSGALDD